MFKAIFYKEWIKTRWYLLVVSVVCGGFLAYVVGRLFKVVELKGAGHIWEVVVLKNALFIDPLTYIPLGVGLLLGIFQYMPEMQRRCFKLTLHLPYPAQRMVFAMLKYGSIVLTLIFGLMFLALYWALDRIFPVELTSRILLSSLPWFLAGYAAYYFAAWITLEPTWKRRVLDMLVAAFTLYAYFLAPAPEAYNAFLPYLAVFTFALLSLSWLSVMRFKQGCQD